MGSLTEPGQINLDKALAPRNEAFGVDHNEIATKRAGIKGPGVYPNADIWWKEPKI